MAMASWLTLPLREHDALHGVGVADACVGQDLLEAALGELADGAAGRAGPDEALRREQHSGCWTAACA